MLKKKKRMESMKGRATTSPPWRCTCCEAGAGAGAGQRC
jgi:hypothetical protein